MSQASEESATVYCQFEECEKRARVTFDVPDDFKMNWDNPMCHKPMCDEHMRQMPLCACQCDDCWGRYTDVEACMTSICAKDPSRKLTPREQAAILREIGNDICDSCRDQDCETKRAAAISANRIALASVPRAPPPTADSDDEDSDDEDSDEGSAESSAEDSAKGSDCETEPVARGEPVAEGELARGLKRTRSQSGLDSDEERGQAKRRAALTGDCGGNETAQACPQQASQPAQI